MLHQPAAPQDKVEHFAYMGMAPSGKEKKTDARELFPDTARLGHVDAASESWVQLRWR